MKDIHLVVFDPTWIANRGTTSAAWSLGLDHFAVSDKGSPNALPPAQGMVNSAFVSHNFHPICDHLHLIIHETLKEPPSSTV